MGKRTRTGKCHICGNTGQLSFEHVPPESAFNDKPIIMKPFEGGKGKIQQRGWVPSHFVKLVIIILAVGMEVIL
jgi:hypothetical protein